MECIVLAGGLGTRLRSSIGDFPKCMAEVNGKPFLHYIFQYLLAQQCSRVILSLGYKHEVITDWLAEESWPFEIDYVIEREPLGTGGGIQLAMQKASTQNVAVLNGDTMFSVALSKLFSFHEDKKSATTLALKEMFDFDRYGVVNKDSDSHIISFEEKQARKQGLINGGVYIINKQDFLDKVLPQKFSFEKDYLEAFVGEQKFYGYEADAYFIDIGIPQDYRQAQEDFKTLFQG
ncbi:MAG: D-mannose-1-phosphate guanyltransferase [Sphingobacteriales bacterium]|nr:MAG: D-mannose-1-phosphate guanyltransferase [Sphingobacteriales bacterium]